MKRERIDKLLVDFGLAQSRTKAQALVMAGAVLVNEQRVDEPFDLVVMDVAFISATKVLPAIVSLLGEEGRLIVLIKPQFEVGRGEVGKGGIVREPEKHARAIETVNQAASELGLKLGRIMESPLRGADGNIEFLGLYER